MTATPKPSTSTATGGPVDFTTSRPLLSGNPIKGAEHRFDAAALKDATFFRPCKPRSFCPLTGLSRTSLIAAAEAAGALTRLRAKKHQVRGALLIHRETLLSYLRSLACEPKEGAHE